jgi:hypothetical protein
LCNRPRADARKVATAPPQTKAAPRTRPLSNVRTISAPRPKS